MNYKKQALDLYKKVFYLDFPKIRDMSANDFLEYLKKQYNPSPATHVRGLQSDWNSLPEE